jgi:hypothetical protein
MANEFEKHIAMDADKSERPDDPGIVGQTRDRVSETARAAGDAVRENAVPITSTALVVGVVGFAIGWMCGQSSARSARYWHY